MAELLFELGTEELPARFVEPALDDLQKTFTEKAAEARITHGAIRGFGTPRRVALLISGVAEKTDDLTVEKTGPSIKAAYDKDGKPTVPAIKFAESLKIPVEQLKKVTTPKGEYLGATVQEKGRPVLELLPELLTTCVRQIKFAKSMRWGDVDQQFGRPLHWIVALLGSEVVPVQFADVKSGRVTFGHRFLSPSPITIAQPADYEAALEKAHVIADVSKRRALVVERVAAAAKKAGGAVLEDSSLVDQVTNLVEWPSPVVGTFDARHLDLPPEVLVQEMKSHQRYFSLLGPDGKLLPKFIAVSNTPVTDEALSVRGYERVLRSRLSDGRFFFDEDRRVTLASRNEMLKRRAWLKELGSMAEKAERIRSLGAWLADATHHGEAKATVERAAELCKSDLGTGMVGEFPELQGVMGREYALHDGEPKEVALAIFEHYLPRGATDSLPTQDAGALIGLADRLDSLAGLFAVGKKPTGAQDQFGLRRAAIAVINIVLARGYRFSLGDAIDQALKLLEPKLVDVKRKPTDAPVKQQVLEFFRGRLESLWAEGRRKDVVDAVLAAGFDDLVPTARRLEAISARVGQPDFAPLAATFKRVANIVEKQAKDISAAPVDATKLVDEAEKALHAAVSKVRDQVVDAAKKDDYSAALEQVVTLKGPVDTFFDKVMVMAEDKGLRENRVRLLMEIGALFGRVADFSRIQSES